MSADTRLAYTGPWIGSSRRLSIARATPIYHAWRPSVGRTKALLFAALLVIPIEWKPAAAAHPDKLFDPKMEAVTHGD